MTHSSRSFGYVSLVALVDWLGGSLQAVVFVQLVLASVAAGGLYLLGVRMHSPLAGVAAAVVFVAHPSSRLWHHYVLTDSPYTSMVILVALSASMALTKRRPWTYALTALLILFAALLRPNGWILFPVVALVLVAMSGFRPRAKAAISVAVAVTFVLAAATVPALRGGVQKERPEEMLFAGHVVWNTDELSIDMPSPSRGQRSGDWVGAVTYVLDHPVASARLAVARLGTELAHVRPWYSGRHNAVLAAATFPVYVLAVIGVVAARCRKETTLVLAIIAAHLLVIAATFADYDGRFLVYFLPLVMLLGAIGGAELVYWAAARSRQAANRRRDAAATRREDALGSDARPL